VEPILRGLMIFVVDDEPAVRRLYVLVLEQAGAAVASSGLATEAVELMRLRSPDVVVTDLQMPTHDGIWLFRETKSRLPNVPVIAVSGHIDESRVDDLRRRGFAEVLRKPVLLSELTNAVARVVGR
jgi:cyclic di-GMP phosphodiesterase